MKRTEYHDIKRENRRKIDEYSQRMVGSKVSFYPAYLQIEQTNRCNANCIMCNHFYLKNRGCGDLPRSVIKKIEPILPYCETVMLNGDGEPFLCPSIEQNIECFCKYGVKIGTNTNLSFIPDGLWRYFSDTFGFLNISCDGASEKTFEMIRRGLKWNTFINNLVHLNASAPYLKKNIDCVVLKQNVKELPEIVKLAADYGINEVRFHRLGVNPCIGNERDQVEYYYDVLEESLITAQSIGNDMGIKVRIPTYQAALSQMVLPQREEMLYEINNREKIVSETMKFVSLSDDYYSQEMTPEDWNNSTWFAGKKCQWGIERCYIDIYGNVTTCCFNMKKNMGSLLRESFEEIWNGQNYTKFRDLMVKQALPGFCINCNWIKDEKF